MDNNNPVKKAHVVHGYTKKQIEELKKCKADPFYFIENYCKVIAPSGQEILFKLYPYQKEMIESAQDNQFTVSLFARQMGKTEAAVSYMLWFAMFNKNRNVLMAAHKFEHIGEIMKRIKQVYEGLPYWLKAGVLNDGYNARSIKFENGSTISGTATTPSAGRGRSIHLLYIDEFAFVPPNIAKEFWASIKPTLSTTGGKCMITSTPSQDDDEFAQIWFGAIDTHDDYGNKTGVGRNGFKAVFADWTRHPNRDEAWADAEERAIGNERFRREFNCEFISFDETLLNPVWIADNLNKMGEEPLKSVGQVRWYREVQPNKTYIVALDPSVGYGGDFAAIQVLQMPEMIQVAEWKHNKTPANGQVRVLLAILKYIESEMTSNSQQRGDPEIYWSVENNSIGETILHVINETGEEQFPGVFQTETRKKGAARTFRRGYNTSNKKKVEACSRMKILLEEGKMHIKSHALIGELKFFVAKGLGFAAKTGKTDDLVMALLLCIRIIEDIMEWDDALREKVAQNIGEDFEEVIEPMPTLLL